MAETTDRLDREFRAPCGAMALLFAIVCLLLGCDSVPPEVGEAKFGHLAAAVPTANDAPPAKYEKLDIIEINSSKRAQPGHCYSPAFGGYECVEIGTVIVFRKKDGGTASISTSHTVDGAYVGTVQSEFGKYSGMYFKSLEDSWTLGADPLLLPDSLSLNGEQQRYYDEIRAAITAYEQGIDLAKDPDAVYGHVSLREFHGIAVARAEVAESDAIRTSGLERDASVAKTLVEVLTNGLDVGTAFVPYVNDARDLYELSTGRDLVSGEELTPFDRTLSAVALIGGSGALYRKIAEKVRSALSRKLLKKAAGGIPSLTHTGQGSWRSGEGLIYRRATKKHENNLRHVLRNTRPDASRPNHTVFSSKPREVPSLIDRAWKTRGDAVSPGVFEVDMKRTVGTAGERRIRIVVEPNSQNIVTAYPIQ